MHHLPVIAPLTCTRCRLIKQLTGTTCRQERIKKKRFLRRAPSRTALWISRDAPAFAHNGPKARSVCRIGLSAAGTVAAGL